MNIQHNLSGHKFGKLKVVRFLEILKGRSIYECVCDCGNITTVKAKYLLNGDTVSCGCRKLEASAENRKKSVTHGLTKHPLYKVWSSMKDRCMNENCHAFNDYGGRGITVCDEWINSFETFFNDMIGGYSQGLELDRENNELGYYKNNCRWVTPTINKRNRRKSVFLTINGITKHIAEWSFETGISRHSIFHRIKHYHYTGEVALYGVRKLKPHAKKVH
jgi:hypothetical protein